MITIKTNQPINPNVGEIALQNDNVLVFNDNEWQIISEGTANRSPKDVKR